MSIPRTKSAKKVANGRALSYVLLALFVGQQLVPDLIKQYPDAKWLVTVGAVVGALYRAYEYLQVAQKASSTTTEEVGGTTANTPPPTS